MLTYLGNVLTVLWDLRYPIGFVAVLLTGALIACQSTALGDAWTDEEIGRPEVTR